MAGGSGLVATVAADGGSSNHLRDGFERGVRAE